MKKPLLEKYIDDKLVQITSLENIRQFAICDNIIKGYTKDGYIVEFEFDTYKSACEGMKILRSKIAQEQIWEKEFEDKIYVTDKIHGTIMPYSTGHFALSDLFEEYLGCDYKLEIEKGKRKVKIKCKDGCIQIERIK